MKLTRVALVLTAGALAPALLFTTPSVAAEAPAGPAAVAAPTAAAESPYDTMSDDDLRVAVGRILARPGISAALRAAAGEVIDGTPEELRHFVTVGQYQV
ncbi:ALF repeat-containing protein [Streptomyces sp. NPDC127106]|uniref:ALF repeat-containing protein n=1 Tax=Streptomyces sp. NPDC127106 TaxID=3345360 RepID=UPI0036325B71